VTDGSTGSRQNRKDKHGGDLHGKKGAIIEGVRPRAGLEKTVEVLFGRSKGLVISLMTLKPWLPDPPRAPFPQARARAPMVSPPSDPSSPTGKAATRLGRALASKAAVHPGHPLVVGEVPDLVDPSDRLQYWRGPWSRPRADSWRSRSRPSESASAVRT